MVDVKKTCGVCGRPISAEEGYAGHGIRKEIEDLIRKDRPAWSDADVICRDDLERYRMAYITETIREEKGQLVDLEAEVLRAIRENEILSDDIEGRYAGTATAGQKIADGVAKFGGSWAFILSFFGILLVWIVVNTLLLLGRPFDPYPFILLNLILSCLAAVQAPIIMMSQNRQETKDRMRSENDYKINLKAELEIRTLHEKVDHLLLVQWARLMEIQEMQIDILGEIKADMKK
jgi:uncharacterized membrane protein